jgi:hypothetical protein
MLFLPAVEVTSIRSGLRKRKRAESPQSTEPQVTEEWVEEEKLELWEIKQYGDRYVVTGYSKNSLIQNWLIRNKMQLEACGVPRLRDRVLCSF